MNLSKITPLVLTFNEEANLERLLDSLDWAERIVVVDSYSSDSTLDILRSHPKVELFVRFFDTFAEQCNFGLNQIETEWVLSMDADYVCPREFVDELRDVPDDPSENGFEAAFRYVSHGRTLRGTLYPNRTVLYRVSQARYHQDGHAHGVHVHGRIGRLETPINHDDRKSLGAWFSAQQRYARDEVAKLRSVPREELGFADRIRLMGWLAPLLTPFFCLIVKRGLLDGRAGWFYALQRTYAEVVLALMLLDEGITAGLSESHGLTATTHYSGDGSASGYKDFPHDISQVVVTVNG